MPSRRPLFVWRVHVIPEKRKVENVIYHDDEKRHARNETNEISGNRTAEERLTAWNFAGVVDDDDDDGGVVTIGATTRRGIRKAN